jgi:hypothetical protein
VFVPGVLAERIAGRGKAENRKEKIESEKTTEDEINALRFFGHPHRKPSG